MSVPLKVPLPLALVNVMVVVLPRLDGLPLASRDWTVTLKGVPTVPAVAVAAVKPSCVAAPAENVIPLVMAVKLCPPDAVAVIVIVPTPE